MDARTKDWIRNTEAVVKENSEKIDKLQRDMDVLTQLVRDIKRSVVRKYKGSKDEQS